MFDLLAKQHRYGDSMPASKGLVAICACQMMSERRNVVLTRAFDGLEDGKAYLLQKNILRDEKDTTLETSAINLPILLVRDDLGKTIFESA